MSLVNVSSRIRRVKLGSITRNENLGLLYFCCFRGRSINGAWLRVDKTLCFFNWYATKILESLKNNLFCLFLMPLCWVMPADQFLYVFPTFVILFESKSSSEEKLENQLSMLLLLTVFLTSGSKHHFYISWSITLAELIRRMFCGYISKVGSGFLHQWGKMF